MRPSINLQSFRDFFKSGQTGSILLLFSVIISLLLANSPLQSNFQSLLHFKLGYENLNLDFPVEVWVNDGLMAIFFLLVGLEIKRELLEGELSTFSKAVLPIFAAIGGMLFPALIYFLINRGSSTASGWGIPMATDIAFALAIISVLGKRVPTALKVFLAALAIVDDLGAIIVIALFYTQQLHTEYLLYAAGVLAILVFLNFKGVKHLVFYLIPGVVLWYFIHHSGIHATIAGVLLALTIPTNPVKEASPLERLEHALTRPVNFIIMPVFALANTNIRFEAEMIAGISSPMGIGILAGLLLGKTTGITFFSWLAVKLKLSTLPNRSGWLHMIGVALLGGIGFTMSVFIALLSFQSTEVQAEAKFAILVASLIAATGGYIFLRMVYKKRHKHLH